MKVAVAQLRATAYDAETNVSSTVEAIGEASAQGAGLVVLPELVSSGYALDAAALREVAEPGDGSGPALSAWSQAAARAGTCVVGGFP
jgi:predicted amidohydrolase